jgi:ribonucleoside-triphosphate reductase
MKKVIKRDGREKAFNVNKIIAAIRKSVEDTYPEKSIQDIFNLTNTIVEKVLEKIESTKQDKLNVEQIQNIIEDALKAVDKKTKQNYSNYRKERTKIRETKSDLMKSIKAIGVETDRDNANVGNNFSSKLLRIASESNKWHVLANMPKHLAKLHENGDLYYHDLDSYNLTTNCLHIPTGKILQRGFNTGYGTINPPKRIESAAELSCILLQATQNDMFGGQSHPNFDIDLGAFVEPTRQEIKEELAEYGITDETIIEKKLIKTIHQAMQAIVYNLNTMHSRAGSQVPFSSVNIGLVSNRDEALVCKIFLEEYEKGLGKGEQPIFPNIIFRVKEGVNKNEGDPYYNLFTTACRVAAKRMNPTFLNIDADFNLEPYLQGHNPATMGCRTALMANVNGEDGVEGRGNIAPTTINVPRIGILAKNDVNKFFVILDERLLQSRESLLHRYSV